MGRYWLGQNVVNLWYRIAAICCAVVIGMYSLFPDSKPPTNSTGGITEHLDHMFAYGILMSLCLLGFGRRLPPALIAVGLLAYGGILELLQYEIPNRDPEYLDVVANSLGIFAGWVLTTILQRLR